jgi:hypothetical protein
MPVIMSWTGARAHALQRSLRMSTLEEEDGRAYTIAAAT